MAENRPPRRKRSFRRAARGVGGCAFRPARSAVIRGPEAAGPPARRPADALRARDERRPGLQARLSRMVVGRGPDRTRHGEGLRRCGREPQRPPAADPHSFAGRLGRRRGGHGRTHPGQGPRGRRRQDADRQLSGSLAEMPGRSRHGDHRRGDLRVGLRARARRRGRTPRRAHRRGSGCIRPPRW